ncbi:hypothetical protein UFOVP594_34 [uncultured Caudovirales phage]|uniref:Terminase-like family n=1 Tax=uncultured Caudovirales phage TaxID=2100421 RepID=A0A6J5N0Z3_9CAUD|nr:hypothetical protein UFOVP594_34 [uncultured Caudovirales phage]
MTTDLQKKIIEKPEFFITEILGDQLWDKQKDILYSVRDHRKTAVRSCNGSGKTYFEPRIAMWFMTAYAPAVVINTAPTWRQVENQYWRYLRQAHSKSTMPLGGKLYKTKWEIDDMWFALGVSNDKNNVEGFQGWHAKNILVIFDEASGIPSEIWEAAQGAMAGGQMVRFLAIGNPNQNSGEFYDCFKDPSYNHIHISAYDVPNVKERRMVIAGLTSHEWVDDMRRKYGETHPVFMIRCLGEFATSNMKTVMSVNSIATAIGADRERYGDDEYIGVDVGRYGSDPSAWVYRKGNYAKILEVMQGNDTMQVAGKTKRYLMDYPNAKAHIDIIGIGAGVFDRLLEQPEVAERVYGVNSAGQPHETDEYINIRAESWFVTREWVKDAVLEPPENIDGGDWYELCQPEYKTNSNGKLQIESKADMEKRGVKSPNVADALVLTLSRPTEGNVSSVVWL